MAEQTDSKVPQIRFKGFDGEWEKKSLREVLKLENGFAFKSRNFCDDRTNVVVLTPGSVKIGGGFQGEKGHFYKAVDEVPLKYKFDAGDVFITMTDLTPTADALGYPARVPDDGVVYLHNQRLGRLVRFNGDEDFLFQLLCTEKYHRNIVTTSSGTTVKHSSPQKILSVENCFPELPEQTQIGGYFKELDGMIGLHQRKHGKLVTLKQAMLQKMFPQNGATTPEIRFKAFSEPWVEKKLGQCVLIQRGGSPRPIENFITQNTDGVNWVKIGDVKTGSRYITKTKEKIRQEGVSMSREVFKGDLILSNSMSFGRPYIMGIDGCIHDGWLLIRDDKELFDVEYLLQLLGSENMLAQYRALAAGGVVNNLNSALVQSTNISFPTKAEQQKIGSYFRQLDTLISKHATQLKKLKQLKSACLEKMFV